MARGESLLDLPVEGVLTYGRVLDRYFTGLTTQRDLEPMMHGLQVIKEEGLGREFHKEYQQVVLRTHRARKIIEWYEKKYGMDEEGMILDPINLHRQIFRKNLTSVRARSYNLSIGFKKQWRYKRFLGYVNHAIYDDLDKDWSWIEKNLERGKNMSSHGLVFFVKNKLVHRNFLKTFIERERLGKVPQKGNIEDMVFELNSPEEFQSASTVDHELRHVIDNIIGTKGKDELLKIVEIQAELNCRKGIRGVGRDLRDLNDSIDRSIKRKEEIIENAKKINHCYFNENFKKQEKVIEREIERLKRRREEIGQVYSEFNESIQNIPRDHWRTLSYVFSYTPDIVVLAQLKRIEKHFKQ